MKIIKRVGCGLVSSVLVLSAVSGSITNSQTGNETGKSVVYAESIFRTFELSESQLKALATVCQSEQGTAKGAAAEASMMANHIDLGTNKAKNFPKTGQGLYDYVKSSGWFSGASGYMDSYYTKNTPREALRSDVLEAVRNVLVNGKRTLPGYIDEHDYSGDIKSVTNNGTAISKSDKSQYQAHVTVIANNMGSVYTFYSFPASQSDAFGYTDKQNRTRIGDAYYSFETGELVDGNSVFPGAEASGYALPASVKAKNKCNTYDASGNVETNRWIDAGDACTIDKVYTNGFVHVEYPSGSTKRWAYAKAENFDISKPADNPVVSEFPGAEASGYDLPLSVKAKNKCNTYDANGNVESNRWIDAGDTCTIDKVYTNGFVHVEYPSGSTKRWAYTKAENFDISKPADNPVVSEFPGAEASGYTLPMNVNAKNKCNTYDANGNVEPNRWIDAGDACTIDKVYTNGYVHVEYPSGSTKRWAYAKAENFDLNSNPGFPGAEVSGYALPASVKAKNKCNTYDANGNVESNRWIDAGDTCTIDKVYTNGFVHVEYPSGSTRRWAYAKAENFDIPKPGDDPGQNNSVNKVVQRAYELYNITWTPLKTIDGYGKNYTFNKGETYHIPYGMPVNTGTFIGYDVSVNDFIEAAKNVNSKLYTSSSGYVSDSFKNAWYCPYYAMDCSTFVSYCWGLDTRRTTSSLPGTDLGGCNSANTGKIQVGDALIKSGHVALVTDVSDGKYEVMEETPPQLRVKTYTKTELVSAFGEYSILRYESGIDFGKEVSEYALPANVKALNKCSTYDSNGNIELNRWIDAGDDCIIDKVYSNGYVHVEYPSGSTRRWAYAKIDNFEAIPKILPTAASTNEPSLVPTKAPSVSPTQLPSADTTKKPEGPSAENPSVNKTVTGDFNGDSRVDITDISTMSVKLVEKVTLTNQEKAAGDVNKDGDVDLSDLATIKQYVTKVIDKF